MTAETKALRWYRNGVITIGLVSLLAATPYGITGTWQGLVLLIALAAAADYLIIETPRGILTVTFALVLPALVLNGFAAAAWVQVLGNVAGNGLLRRRPLHVILFNAGQFALSALLAGAVFRLAGGMDGSAHAHEVTVWPMVLYIITYSFVNHALVELYLNFSGGRWTWSGWLESIREDLLNNSVAVPIGLLLIYVIDSYGYPSAILPVVPLLVSAHILRLHQGLAMTHQELRSLYEFSVGVASALKVDRVFDFVLDSVRNLVRHDFCALFLWDETRKELVLQAVRHPAADRLRGLSFKLGEGIVGYVARTGVGELVEDAQVDPRNVPVQADPSPLRGGLFVPLIVEGQLIGVITLGSYGPRSFSQDHLRLVTIACSQAAMAIKNAILYRRTEELAITDSMTGLYNYRYFYIRLADEIQRARDQGRKLSVIYLDLDDFKQYNDLHGHQAGDAVLRDFAFLIRKCTRDSDVAARYAGDEFVVLLPNTDQPEATVVGERIRAAVEEFSFDTACNLRLRVTVSVGIAAFPADAEDESELIHAADKAMYSSKALGNRVSTYAGAQ